MSEFEAPLKGLSIEDFAGRGFYQMGRPPLRIDVLMELDGVNFSDCWENRISTILEEVPVYIIGLEDLIKNKRATGRPADLLDIENLNSSIEKQ